jgi:metal-sulfur cluster biosynthetic enzyme
MATSIANMVRTKVLEIPGVREADVRLVWDPVWSPAMMTETARKKLGWS